MLPPCMTHLALEISAAIGLCCWKREHINLETVSLVSVLAQAKQLFSSLVF